MTSCPASRSRWAATFMVSKIESAVASRRGAVAGGIPRQYRPTPRPTYDGPMTVTRLLLIRHGATTATEEDRFSGAMETELSDQGRWQAGQLGDRLAGLDLAAIYASPLSRALDTARI